MLTINKFRIICSYPSSSHACQPSSESIFKALEFLFESSYCLGLDLFDFFIDHFHKFWSSRGDPNVIFFFGCLLIRKDDNSHQSLLLEYFSEEISCAMDLLKKSSNFFEPDKDIIQKCLLGINYLLELFDFR